MKNRKLGFALLTTLLVIVMAVPFATAQEQTLNFFSTQFNNVEESEKFR